MYEYTETHFQRREYIVVERVSKTVAGVDSETYPLFLAIRLAQVKTRNAAVSTYSVEDADTGEVVWPKEEEDVE